MPQQINGKPSDFLAEDEVWMRRALQLARLGKGNVSPNPLVGAVIVYEGRCIGEGFHRKFGGSHAEVEAINAVENSALIAQSTVYVNLEPCSHQGKTPPCVDLLLRHRPRRVVVANQDPNPLVAGKGIQKLREAGIETQTGLLEEEAAALNRRFFTHILQQRPYIILKWAETADGFIAHTNGDSRWISNSLSRMRVHQWRGEEDAVLVGSLTALYDNPRLNVRDWTGRNPIRALIDRKGVLPPNLHLFDGSRETLYYGLAAPQDERKALCISLEEKDFLPALFRDMYARKIGSVLVEGGAGLINALTKARLWDEARVFKCPPLFGTGIAAPVLPNARFKKEEKVAEDRLVYFCSA